MTSVLKNHHITKCQGFHLHCPQTFSVPWKTSEPMLETMKGWKMVEVDMWCFWAARNSFILFQPLPTLTWNLLFSYSRAGGTHFTPNPEGGMWPSSDQLKLHIPLIAKMDNDKPLGLHFFPPETSELDLEVVTSQSGYKVGLLLRRSWVGGLVVKSYCWEQIWSWAGALTIWLEHKFAVSWKHLFLRNKWASCSRNPC